MEPEWYKLPWQSIRRMATDALKRGDVTMACEMMAVSITKELEERREAIDRLNNACKTLKAGDF